MQDYCFATQTVLLYLVANLLRNYVHFWHKVQVLTSQTTQATAFELGQLLQLRLKVYLIGLFKRLVDGLLTATFPILVGQLMFSQTFQNDW